MVNMRNSNQMAPVVVFVYNRLKHAKNCINSLCAAEGANDTKLYIFSDAPKRGQEKNVDSVRRYIHENDILQSFKSVNIYEAECNQGLAKSIITGVTQIINKYGKCIVLEDDVTVTRDFLLYMNAALDFYKKSKDVWSIGGLNLIDPDFIANDVYFAERICSCSWATWDDRWKCVDWKVEDYNNFRFDFYSRYKFNRFGTDRSNMLDRQMLKKINSWAIRFDYSGFKNHKVTVYPKYTKAKDNGHDGSGTHFTAATQRLNVDLPEKIHEFDLIEYTVVDDKIAREYRKLFALRWQARTKRIILRELELLTGKCFFK